MSATIPQSKEELIDAARSAGEELVRLRAEQEYVWEELLASQAAQVPDCRPIIPIIDRYERASLAVVVAFCQFRRTIRRVGIAGYSAEYLTIAYDVYERLGWRPPLEVLGAEQAPGFAFAGGPAA